MIKKILLTVFVMFAFTPVITMALPKVPSASEIKAEKEKSYETQIDRINAQDPVKDAEAAIELDFPYVMAHYAGRSRTLVVPGLNEEQSKQAEENCPVLIMEGIGDVVYGEQHIEYRKVATEYAKTFNQKTFKACMGQ